MNEIQHQFSRIYDKLNGQPHLQELIATPLLEQLHLEELEDEWVQYHIRQKPWQDLMIYELTTITDNISWDIDANPGSFPCYIFFSLSS